MTLGPGALVWTGYRGAFPDDAVLAAVRAGRVGGVVLFARNASSGEALRGSVGALCEAAAAGGLPPPTIAVDQEGGSVVRLGHRAIFPGAMALAATGDLDLVARVARSTALGLRADGIGVDLAPVCDVNTEPANPVIGTRSFGDDPAQVAACIDAWVRGSLSAGVAAVAKHFPGHGATRHDTHHTTVDVRADRALLVARELIPFRAAFAAGAPAALCAHVRYPALDEVDIATLSYRIATRLLREELGFAGLLLSDDLAMGGATASGPAETLVPRAIAAGVDTVLLTSGEGADDVAEWIALGVTPGRVLEALGRARAFRKRFAVAPASFEGRPMSRAAEPLTSAGSSEGPATTYDDAGARALAREAAERSLTLVGGTLPRLSGALRVAALAPDAASPVQALHDPAGRLERALRYRFGQQLAFAVGAEPDGEGPLVVCTWSARFDADRGARAAMLLEGASVHCALRSPYDAGLGPPLPTLLTYGDVPASLDALAAALSGALAPQGGPPVRLAAAFC